MAILVEARDSTVALAALRLPWQRDGGSDDSATCTPNCGTDGGGDGGSGNGSGDGDCGGGGNDGGAMVPVEA